MKPGRRADRPRSHRPRGDRGAPPGREARSGRPARSASAGIDLLYGRNPVVEALRAGRRVYRVLVSQTARESGLQDVLEAANGAGVPVQPVEREQLDAYLGDTHHQGVIAEAEPYRYASLEDFPRVAAERGELPLVLALDSLQDPQNLGSLLRTALACGVHGAIIPEHRAASVTAAVSKASAGAVEHLAVARATNLVRALESLKQAGVWVYGLALDGGPTFWEVDWTTPSALVVGAEGAGLGRLVRETCDGLVRIPMSVHAVQSLNAATAGSIALYEAFRQRSTAPASPPV